MLDWHSCQICYPLEIKILLFRRLYLMWSAIITPPRLVFNVPCLSAARSLRSKLKPSMCKILSSVFSSRNVSYKPSMSNLNDEFKRRLISSSFGFMWHILTLTSLRPCVRTFEVQTRAIVSTCILALELTNVIL